VDLKRILAKEILLVRLRQNAPIDDVTPQRSQKGVGDFARE
jgi:hypothetical protein